MSNTRDSVSSAFRTPRILSMILRCSSLFQLSSRCLDIPMKHCLSCLIYYIKLKGLNSIIISNMLLSSGARACNALNQFEEAIKWCDEGFEVSFYNCADIQSIVND